jgi:hypothetical protein
MADPKHVDEGDASRQEKGHSKNAKVLHLVEATVNRVVEKV